MRLPARFLIIGGVPASMLPLHIILVLSLKNSGALGTALCRALEAYSCGLAKNQHHLAPTLAAHTGLLNRSLSNAVVLTKAPRKLIDASALDDPRLRATPSPPSTARYSMRADV